MLHIPSYHRLHFLLQDSQTTYDRQGIPFFHHQELTHTSYTGTDCSHFPHDNGNRYECLGTWERLVVVVHQHQQISFYRFLLQ